MQKSSAKAFLNAFLSHNWGGELVIALLAFGVYRYTAAPSIGWIDSGVITAAAKTLGIANPPGFPSYMILAWVWGHLVPFGSWLLRLQVLSHGGALVMGLVVSRWTRELVAEVVEDIPHWLPRVAGWWAMVVVLFSYSVWSQAINVETFTWTYALVYVIAYCAWRLGGFWRVASLRGEEQKQKYPLFGWPLLALAVLGGVALGFNPTATVLAPATVLWVWQLRKELWIRRWWVVAAVVLGLVTVGVVYSYLPLRAATSPTMNWGDPRTPERLWAHLTAAGLNINDPASNAINGFTGSPLVAVLSLRNYVASGLLQFTPLVLIFSCIGWWALRQSSAVGWLGGVVAMNLLWVLVYFGGNQESWMIASWVAWAIAAGVGMAVVWQRAHDWQWQVLIVGVALVPLLFWAPLLNHHDHWYTRDYLDNLWREVPSGAVVIGGGDLFHSLTHYQQVVLEERTDLITITGNMFYIFPWYRADVAAKHELVVSAALEEKATVVTETGFTEVVDQLIADNPGRRFFITPLMLRESVVAGTDKGIYNSAQYEVRPHGLLLEIVPKGSPREPVAAAYEFTYQKPFGERDPFFIERNYKTLFESIRSDYADAWLRRAEYYQSVGALAEAEVAYRTARELGPLSMGGYEQRLGIFLAEQGRLEEAKPFFEEAVNRAPQDANIMQNAQRFQQQVAQKYAYDTRASQEWKPSIWMVEHGILQGKVPPNWVATPDEVGVRLAPQAGGAAVDVTIVPIASEAEMNEWLIQTQSSFGLLLDSGMAELPGVEMAMIRLWQNQEKVQINEFIIPHPEGLVRIVVTPGESTLQATVNELLTVFVPQFEPK